MKPAVLFFSALPLLAQSLEPLVLSESTPIRIAADSKGNIVALGTSTASLCGSFCIGPSFIAVYALFRYDPSGRLIETVPSTLSTSNRVAFLRIDSHDVVYFGGVMSPDGRPFLWRSGTAAPWTPDLGERALDLRDLAFDAQDHPILLAKDTDAAPGIRLIKLDSSGRRTAEFRFGSRNDQSEALAAGPDGSVYVAGFTSSADFPLTPGAFRPSWPSYCASPDERGTYPCMQGFVAKVDSALQRLLYSTLFGSSFPVALAPGPDGSLYVAGNVISAFAETDFPTTPEAWQPAVPAGRLLRPGKWFTVAPSAPFVARLNGAGSALIASTYLAGHYTDSALTLRVDASGNPLVLGRTASRDFPATGAWRTPCGPDRGAATDDGGFATKMDPMLSRVESSAVLAQRPIAAASDLMPDGSLYAITETASGGTRRIVRIRPSGASQVACIVNGASMLAQDSIAPGQLLTVFGEALGAGGLRVFDATAGLPLSSDGAEVWIGGRPAPLLAVSPGQLNVVAPYEIEGSRVPVDVLLDGVSLFRSEMAFVPLAPSPLLRFGPNGELDFDQLSLPLLPLADAINEDGTANSESNPAPRGSLLTVYATGFGRLLPDARSGAAGGLQPASPVWKDLAILTWYGTYPVESVRTAPGRTNAVLAVKFLVPAIDAGGRLAFAVTSGQSPQVTNFFYVRPGGTASQ